MHRRLLPFCAVVFAVAFAVLLSRASSSASAPISEADHAPRRSVTSSVTTITTDTITIPTYPYAAYLYTATNTTYNIPYRWLNWGQYEGSHPQPVDQDLHAPHAGERLAARQPAARTRRARLRDDLQAHGQQRTLSQPGDQAHALGSERARLVAGRGRPRVGLARRRTRLRKRDPVAVRCDHRHGWDHGDAAGLTATRSAARGDLGLSPQRSRRADRPAAHRKRSRLSISTSSGGTTRCSRRGRATRSGNRAATPTASISNSSFLNRR